MPRNVVRESVTHNTLMCVPYRHDMVSAACRWRRRPSDMEDIVARQRKTNYSMQSGTFLTHAQNLTVAAKFLGESHHCLQARAAVSETMMAASSSTTECITKKLRRSKAM